ncbi:MAG: 4-hydroxy-3-methylbut-2-enyl diphosphate reductase [Enterobacterales bacterium]
MHILLANPRGFCAGVKRAIQIVNYALKIYKKPIYVKHEIVHNKYVINNFKKQGVIFIEKIIDVPPQSVLIFSAHGVSKSIYKEAYKRNLIIFNATCPLVTKVHKEVIMASNNNIETIIIGHYGHPEIEGTIGQYTSSNGKIILVESKKDVSLINVKNPNDLYCVTQTTLSIDYVNDILAELKKRFPKIKTSKTKDICYATTNRQEAVKILAHQSDVVFIIGSSNSSNSNRLSELSKDICEKTYLIEDFTDIKKSWLKNCKNIGITAGASSPDILIKQVIKYLKLLGAKSVSEIHGKKENIRFNIPKKLKISVKLI